MEINALNESALPQEIQSQYMVKCMKMAQQTESVTGSLIEDTVEFSQEAMDKYLAEIQAK